MSLPGDDAIAEVMMHHDSDPETRILVYNRVSQALRALVADVADDPVLAVQLILAEKVTPNDYNPNRVASVELDLLETSIRADGVTMPVVTVHDPASDRWIVVDGFHRQRIVKERLRRRWVPCSVIDRPMGDRMASTIRHNRARGKHVVDLMAELVRRLSSGEGWTDEKIAQHLGMSVEELLRLKQTIGAAKLLAADDYGEFYGRDDEPTLAPEDEP